MAKKDFTSGLDATIKSSLNQKQGSRQHPTVSAQEAQERRAAGKTQGAKGAAMPRINLAFTEENYNFIKRFARCRGDNMTDFVNHIIDDYREEHIKEFEKIEAFINNT